MGFFKSVTAKYYNILRSNTQKIMYLCNMLITRKIQDILNHFHKGKAILIEGPGQVGKATLIQTLLKSLRFL